MLIFKEGDQPFDPLCIKSHFNHIFAVVQVHERRDGKPYSYKLSIGNRTGVNPYGPFLINPPIYIKNAEFREFLFTKLINAERAAMISPDFKGKMTRTAKDLLTNIGKEFIPRAKKKKIIVPTQAPTPPSPTSEMIRNFSSSSYSSANHSSSSYNSGNKLHFLFLNFI